MDVCSQGSSVNTVICYGLNDRGSISGKGRDFSVHHRVQTCSGVHPASSLMGSGRSEHEADHSPLPSARVKKAWSCTSTHSMVLD